MIKKILIFIFTFLCCFGFSQEKFLNGIVQTNTVLQGINVENLNREISVQTDENGNFSIIAAIGEVLVFSSINIEKKVFWIKEEHFENLVEVELKSTSIEIEKVEIGKQMDLGLGGKKLTRAERRYHTGGKILKMNQGFEFNLEAVGNLFNGKRKELKKALEIEKQERRFLELDYYFDKDFYVNSLGLNPLYINDFKYFLIDDFKFQSVLKHGNENDIIIEAVKMYESYQKIKTDEN